MVFLNILVYDLGVVQKVIFDLEKNQGRMKQL